MLLALYFLTFFASLFLMVHCVENRNLPGFFLFLSMFVFSLLLLKMQPEAIELDEECIPIEYLELQEFIRYDSAQDI